MKTSGLFVLVAAITLVAALPETAQSQTPEASDAPTPSPSWTGSITGRIYVDVNSNGEYDAPDVPLEFPLLLKPTYNSAASQPDGTYAFANLPAGTYTVAINLARTAGGCSPLPAFTWAGEPQAGYLCPTLVGLDTNSLTVDVAQEAVTGADIVGVPHSFVRGSLWLDGAAARGDTQVAVAVGGVPCWSGIVERVFSLTTIPIAYYRVDIDDFADPRCIDGAVSLLVNGQQVGPSLEWRRFWIERLDIAFTTGPLNEFEEVMSPEFLGVAGVVITSDLDDYLSSVHTEAEPVPVEDGMVVRAFVGKTQCGEAATGGLRDSNGRLVGNLFGLIVSPTSLGQICGQPGAPVGLCVGSYEADGGTIGEWQPPSFLGEMRQITWEPGRFVRVVAAPTAEICPLGPLSFPPTGGRP